MIDGEDVDFNARESNRLYDLHNDVNAKGNRKIVYPTTTKFNDVLIVVVELRTGWDITP